MTSLAYRSEGSGEPVFFVHGWGLNSSVWDKQLKSLSDEFQTIAVDLPGHGRTEPKANKLTVEAAAACLRDLVNELRFKKVHLVGWSLGTHVVCRAALMLGFDTVRSITIVDGTPCFVKHNDEDSWAQPETKTKWVLRGLENNFVETLTEFITTSCYTKKEVKPNIEQMMKSLFFNEHFPPDKKSAIELLSDFAESDIRPLLSDLKLPCLICHGERDSILPVEITKIWETFLPDTRTVIIENAGHAPFLTQPDLFNESLRNFLHSL